MQAPKMHNPKPVAFFFYNRPDTTECVFRRIAESRPRQLYLICDGPRVNRPDDLQKIDACQRIVSEINWPCEVSQSYSEQNLGCQQRLVSGLKWLFSQVEEAIILEDDCVPELSFFDFCAELLDRYRDELRIAGISGTSFQQGHSCTPYSYYFSKYFHCWGWATWRRVWQQYDPHITTWPAFRADGRLQKCYRTDNEQRYWRKMLDAHFAGRGDTWDGAWAFGNICRGDLTIIPDRNLVSNIGFRPDATHTNVKCWYAELPTFSIGPLSHPPDIQAHVDADDFTGENHYSLPREPVFTRIQRKLKKVWSSWNAR